MCPLRSVLPAQVFAQELQHRELPAAMPATSDPVVDFYDWPREVPGGERIVCQVDATWAELRERGYGDKCVDNAESGEEAVSVPKGGPRSRGGVKPLGEMSFMGY